MFEGFYKVQFQLGEAVGRSVMHVGDGKMLGGNSAFGHIGTYQKTGEQLAVARDQLQRPGPSAGFVSTCQPAGNFMCEFSGLFNSWKCLASTASKHAGECR